MEVASVRLGVSLETEGEGVGGNKDDTEACDSYKETGGGALYLGGGAGTGKRDGGGGSQGFGSRLLL